MHWRNQRRRFQRPGRRRCGRLRPERVALAALFVYLSARPGASVAVAADRDAGRRRDRQPDRPASTAAAVTDFIKLPLVAGVQPRRHIDHRRRSVLVLVIEVGRDARRLSLPLALRRRDRRTRAAAGSLPRRAARLARACGPADRSGPGDRRRPRVSQAARGPAGQRVVSSPRRRCAAPPPEPARCRSRSRSRTSTARRGQACRRRRPPGRGHQTGTLAQALAGRRGRGREPASPWHRPSTGSRHVWTACRRQK